MLALSLSLSPFSSFFSRSFLFFLQSWVSLRKKRGLKPLWNTRCSPFTTLSLSSPSSSLCLSLSLSLVLSSFPDRCMSFRTVMSTIRLRFGCFLFPTAACLSGPQWLQLEYVLGACFSGPLHVFRTAISTIRVLFWCLLFRTAACLSGPQWLQLEYVLGACFSGPLHVFRSTIRVRFGCLLFRTAACLSGPQCLQLEYVLGACFVSVSFSLLFFLFRFFPVFSPKLS